jgi:adenosylcobyric acid synthase
MSAKKIMVQGTGSFVGKSVVTAALCRYFRQEGLRVAPFKAQNMSNNSYVTADGGEIGRAQAFQAAACGIEPTVEMNPVLLKPSSDLGSQVVLGKAVKVMRPREYHQYQPNVVGVIQASLQKLSRQYDIIVIEGAGSPAEINLRPFDIVNMAVARMASAPVILVGDINLGGVFAWLVGTLELLATEERSLVKAFLINKFRGDISLLDDGIKFLETKTGKKVLGVLPYVAGLQVAEEDSVPESRWRSNRPRDSDKLDVAVIPFPHLSNSTDFDGLESEPDVRLRYIAQPPEAGEPVDLLILPGSKSTMADLAYLRSSGLSHYIQWCHEAHVPIVGICGGYQMLGSRLLDPEGVESTTATAEGLGLLDHVTMFESEKKTVQVRALSLDFDEEVSGYEIHMGRTQNAGHVRPMFHVRAEGGRTVSRVDGGRSENGLVWGTYIHGIFDAPTFRRQFLNTLRKRRSWAPLRAQTHASDQDGLDSLAEIVRENLDLPLLQHILDGVV